MNHSSIRMFVDQQPPAASKHDSQGHANFIGRNRICYSLPVSNASDPAALNVAFEYGWCKSACSGASATDWLGALSSIAAHTGRSKSESGRLKKCSVVAAATLATVGGTYLAR